MTPDELAQYKHLFIDTARRNIHLLKNNLSLLKKQRENSDIIYALYLSSHSLKNESGAMGHKDLAALCQVIEHIFNMLRLKKLILSDELYTVLGEIFSKLEESIKKIDTGNQETDLSLYLEKLKNIPDVSKTL